MNKSSVEERVLRFYEHQPFNAYSSVARQVQDIRDVNQIEIAYPDLDRILRQPATASFLDAGCGTGWLALSVAHHYGLRCQGFDFNPKAVEMARAAAAEMKSGALFRVGNLFDDPPEGASFDVVCSLGVVHHTPEPFAAIERITRHLSPSAEARLYLGVYHAPGRGPFLAFFEEMRRAGKSEEEMFQAFAALHRDLDDEALVRSWFRDQVLHPHESSHTLAEVATFLGTIGFEVESTSINRYASFASLEDLFLAEEAYAAISHQRNFVEGRYFPGFFTVCARRRARP